MFKDGQTWEGDGVRQFDIAIIGAGMAGITLAERLRGNGRRICLIEGGDADPSVRDQRLNRGRIVGREYFGLDRCRFRVFGGSSIRWGGWCRPLDPADFERRDWIAHSGWPIAYDELAPYIAQTASVVELDNPRFEVDAWRDRMPPPTGLGGPELEPVIVQHSAEIDFGERARAAFAAADDLVVLLNSNVTELRLVPGTSRVDRAEVATLSGNRFAVRADTFVLATGAIENARVLLASMQDRPAGLGNETDCVGRFFMEHPHAVAGHIVPNPGHGLPPFFTRSELGDTAWVHGSLSPTAAASRARRLPTCFLTLDMMPHVAGTSALLDLPQALITPPAVAYRRLQRRHPELGRRLRSTVASTWRIGRELRNVRRAGVSREELHGAISVYVRGEQTPNRDSRVTLDAVRDELGIPRLQLDWRIADSDLAAVDQWNETFGRSLEASGFGRLVTTDWRGHLTGGPHHMGTTRMSVSPRDGVVDADCKVHTVENLYVAGSSVFTTSGHANPSYTMIALTLRLADHLRARTGASTRPAVAPVAMTCPNV